MRWVRRRRFLLGTAAVMVICMRVSSVGVPVSVTMPVMMTTIVVTGMRCRASITQRVQMMV